jgi:hypothetical protein
MDVIFTFNDSGKKIEFSQFNFEILGILEGILGLFEGLLSFLL